MGPFDDKVSMPGEPAMNSAFTRGRAGAGGRQVLARLRFVGRGGLGRFGGIQVLGALLGLGRSRAGLGALPLELQGVGGGAEDHRRDAAAEGWVGGGEDLLDGGQGGRTRGLAAVDGLEVRGDGPGLDALGAEVEGAVILGGDVGKGGAPVGEEGGEQGHVQGAELGLGVGFGEGLVALAGHSGGVYGF